MENPGLISLYKKKKMFCPKMRPQKNYIQLWDSSNTYELRKNEEEAVDKEYQYSENLEAVMSNYIIVRKIIASCDWRDALVASAVCQLWRSAWLHVNRDRLHPQAFCLEYQQNPERLLYKSTEPCCIKPMLTMAFVNNPAMVIRCECKLYPGNPCDEDCQAKHKMLDYIHAKVCYPSDSLVGVACAVAAFSFQMQHLGWHSELNSNFAFVGGLSIPQVPGVKVHRLKHQVGAASCLGEPPCAFRDISKLLDTQLVKCVIVLTSQRPGNGEHIIKKFVDIIKERQGEAGPFALGGCMVKGTILGHYHYCRPTESRKIVFIVMTVDKTAQDSTEFDSYSRVIADGPDTTKEEFAARLADFSKRVPWRQFSAAIKLSCVGRIYLNDLEHEMITENLPGTPIAGCYGMGEIGHDHFPGTNPFIQSDYEPLPLVYSYSTIIVMLTWGRLR